jgi:hypothetical protein
MNVNSKVLVKKDLAGFYLQGQYRYQIFLISGDFVISKANTPREKPFLFI